eukprot:CAMPEP_0198685428 /NCGR_PEP_ID=MMETSP1468-20131203/13634_1 /TAXON_ID=1461545 /ORGANISM="Mantoniella sp, Strain CCMP1436" /LENGTH=80 /DNA_ID=CAMNT_0044430909 /DNA_START=214 /DNA_END=457 /DNA_ORIENTATION=-
MTDKITLNHVNLGASTASGSRESIGGCGRWSSGDARKVTPPRPRVSDVIGSIERLRWARVNGVPMPGSRSSARKPPQEGV